MISFSVHGVRTFNGDGTGTVVGRSVGFTLPREQPFLSRGGAFSTEFTADFAYEVFPDGTFSASSTVINSTNLTGTRKGQTSTTGPIQLVGQISRDRKTLTTATDTPTVETVNFSNGDVQKRICHRSRMHLKLKSGHGHQHDDD